MNNITVEYPDPFGRAITLFAFLVLLVFGIVVTLIVALIKKLKK